MCTLLGFDADDEIRAGWWSFAGRLARRAHRHSLYAPRPVDDEFREWWALGQAVVVTASFTATAARLFAR
jgi:hypothetical protein